MAGDTQETSSSSQQETWEASQYENALAQLERLQAQLDNLRSTIPALVTPFVRPPPGGSVKMFAEVRKSALQSTNDLQTFREQWTSEQTQQLLARSKQSFEKDGDLTKSVDVAKWGWSSERTPGF